MKWLKRIGVAAILLLAVYGAMQLMPEPDTVVDVYYPTSFATTPYGVIGFPGFNAKSGRDFMDGGVNAVRQIAGGTLVMPDGASPLSASWTA
jgi:hypothetical protein